MNKRNIAAYLLLAALPLALVLLNIKVYQYASRLSDKIHQANARSEALEMGLRIQNHLAERANDLEVLSEVLRAHREDPDFEHFHEIANGFVTGNGCYHAINYVDPEGIVRATVPKSNEPALLGRDLKELPGRIDMHARARTAGHATVSQPIVLVGKYPGFVMWHPITTNGSETFHGFAAGAIKIEDFVKEVFQETSTHFFALRVSLSDQPIYSSPDAPKSASASVAGVERFEAFGQPWKIEALFREGTPLSDLGRPAQWSLYVGIGLSLLAGALLFGVAHSNRRLSISQARAKASEEDLRITLESIGDAVIATDVQGRVRRMNRVAETLTGWAFSEAQGRTLAEVFRIVNALTREPSANPVQRVIESGAILGLANHTVLIARDGREYQIADSGAPIKEENGATRGVVLVFRDVTEEYALQNALRESEAWLEETMRIARVGGWKIDLSGNTLAWTDETFRIHDLPIGASPNVDEAISFYHADDRARVSAAVQHALESGEDYDIEARIITATKNLKWVRSIGHTSLHEGRTAFVWGTIQDITDLKQTEEAVRESEQRFATAFKYSPAPLVLSEVDTGLFLDVNDRWVEMLEFTREEQIGRTSKEVGIWDDPGDRDRIVAILRSQDRFRDEPIRFKTKSGRPVIALWSAESVNLSGKQVMLSMITDITELRQAEEEREKLRGQLTQAHKMEAVGRLAGGVAHDFNNMLNVILGHAEIMSEDLPADSPLRGDLDEIRKAAERSANLTRQLLAFARKQTVAPKALDLNDTIATMLKMLQRLIGEDIDLLWKPGASLDTVRIDPGQVDQMLANLAVNARDAIGHAHGKITIETANARFDEAYCADHAGFTPGDFVMLAVSDNGCGMDEETRANIFEPFFTTKGVGEGTGLGLATVYGIVKQNDGYVNVYSEPGQGTTFKIYFPSLAEVSTRPAGVEAGLDAPATGDETILVVEDQPALLKMARTMLERLGYNVLIAATPGEALRLAREQSGSIDLLITDVVMPEMNGRELAQQLQALRPGLKSLFMSGYTANVIAHQGVLDEGVIFIQKPFSKGDLAAKVREVLDRK